MSGRHVIRIEHALLSRWFSRYRSRQGVCLRRDVFLEEKAKIRDEILFLKDRMIVTLR